MNRWVAWLSFVLLAVPAGSAPGEGRARPGPVRLSAPNWAPANRVRLERLLQRHGRGSRSYDPTRPPYAVFDWDNTSVFLDVEEATIVFQLQQLRFGATPAELERAVKAGVPDTPFAPEFRNAAGEPLDIDKVASDVCSSYSWLYAHYSGLGGDLSLEAVQKTPQYRDFITKYRFLYDALDGTFGAPVSYPWITYFFTGLTPAEVQNLSRDAVRWQLRQPIERVTWTSPSDLPGRSGVVSVSWKNGLRLLPEMQELQRTLREEGFDVWICTASLSDVIRGVAGEPEFGYRHAPDRVIGMELLQDERGRFQPQPRPGWELTFGAGKSAAIRRRLLPLYQGRGPLLVAGDSEGDQDMLEDFLDTELSLIVDRQPRPASPLARMIQSGRENPGGRYAVQRRDERQGSFVPLD